MGQETRTSQTQKTNPIKPSNHKNSTRCYSYPQMVYLNHSNQQGHYSLFLLLLKSDSSSIHLFVYMFNCSYTYTKHFTLHYMLKIKVQYLSHNNCPYSDIFLHC